MRWNKSERRVALFAFVVGVAGVGYLTRLRSDPARPDVLPISRGGVELTRLERPLVVGIPTVAGGEHDYQLKSPRMRLTIGGRADSAESELRRGALLDLALDDIRADRLRRLKPVLSVGGRLLPLRTLSIAPEATDQRVRLVIEHSAGAFLLTTRVWLASDAAVVHLHSSVEYDGKRTSDPVSLGDHVEWPGMPSYAPRLGFVTESTYAEVPWLAKESARLSYALVFEGDPVQADFLFDRVGPVGALVLGKSRRLARGERLEYRRKLLVDQGRLAGVTARVFRAQGKRLGRVSGRIEPRPSRSLVVVNLPDGKPLTQLEPSSTGKFDLSLPVGEYVIVAETPGGTDRERVVVTSKKTTRLQLLAPLASSLRYTIRDEAGRLMPGRVAVRGVAPTKNPDFGARQRAAGVRNLAYSASGEGELELAAGRYRVFVTRGIEYSIFESVIDIAPDAGASVRAVLQHELDTPGWVSGDFHVHAAPSFDSAVPLVDRVTSLAAEGVEFAVATDHNHVTDYGPALGEARLTEHLGSTPGVEVTTERWGHFIAFPYPPEQPPPPYEGLDPHGIFEAVRALAPNSLIQVNHPRMDRIAYFAGLDVGPNVSAVGDRGPEALADQVTGAGGQGSREANSGPELLSPPAGFSFDFDSIEVVNGFELDKPQAIAQNLADWFALLNVGLRYTAVGNSDSHALVHQWAGFPRTYVKVATADPSLLQGAEVADALLYGRAQVSNGIFLDVRANGSRGPGDQLALEGRNLELRILARAAPWVSVSRAELWVNGVRRSETTRTAGPNAKNRIQWATRLELSADAWVVVAAWGETELGERYPGAKGLPFCITNPLFVDVDGDGEFRAPLAPARQPPDSNGTRPRGPLEEPSDFGVEPSLPVPGDFAQESLPFQPDFGPDFGAAAGSAEIEYSEEAPRDFRAPTAPAAEH